MQGVGFVLNDEGYSMKRRSIVSLSGAAMLGAALPAFAQTQRVMRIGTLETVPLSTLPASNLHVVWDRIFVDELRRLGWEEGRNLIYERRYALNDPQKHYANAEELVAARVDLIYCTNLIPTAAAYKATKSIPIVASTFGLVEFGYAKSLAQPGGNVTGFEITGLDGYGKTIEWLHAIVPGLKRIGYSEGRGIPATQSGLPLMQTAAGAKGVQVVALPNISDMADIDPLLSAAKREGIQALVLGPATFFLAGRGALKVQTWATENKVLTYSNSWHRGELLMAQGVDFPYIQRALARIIDRIFRGAKPADIPIERSMRFELIISQKLAKAIGLTIPLPVLLQATQVIE
jgi:putative tryptophan/tyrosine transport system substrate-binding protein